MTDYKISFLGEYEQGYERTRTQPGQSGVASFRLDPSGQWLITVDRETGQQCMARVRPETTFIVIDAIRGGSDG